MAKVSDLEKKQRKVEKELEKAKLVYEKQKELVEAKEEELKRVNAELISSLLIENNMTMAELTAMFSGDISEKNENQKKLEPKQPIIEEEQAHETAIS